MLHQPTQFQSLEYRAKIQVQLYRIKNQHFYHLKRYFGIITNLREKIARRVKI